MTEHHVHDVQFVGQQIKLINVYSPAHSPGVTARH